MTNPRDAFTKQLAEHCPWLTEKDLDAILHAYDREHTAVTHPRTAGPSLTYTHSDGQTRTDVDVWPVSVDNTAPNRRRERALCRVLLIEALRLMDTTEPTTTTCGNVRTEAAPDWPCVLTPGHSGYHVDTDGATFQ